MNLSLSQRPRDKLKIWLLASISLQMVCVLSLEFLALESLTRLNPRLDPVAAVLTVLPTVFVALWLGSYVNKGVRIKPLTLREMLGSSLPLCAIFIILALNDSVLTLFFELLRPYAFAPWLQAALYALCFMAFPAYLLGQNLDASYQRLGRVRPTLLSMVAVGTAFFLAVLFTVNPGNGLWSVLAVLSLVVFATAKTLGPQLLMLSVLISAFVMNGL